MKSLKPRLITAVVGIAFLLLIIFVSGYFNPIIGILTGLATTLMTSEYLKAHNLLKVWGVSLPCLIFSLLLPILISTKFAYLLLFCFMLSVFVFLIMHYQKITYTGLAYAVTGSILISFGMSALPKICSQSVTGTPFYFVTVFAIPWMADTGGFFVGSLIGKHKLCPNISPKKTVEGAIGGLIFCIISAVVIGLLFQFVFMPDLKFNFTALILLGLIDAPLSIIGDLSFSLIKRSFKIKDYGTIFPGHGGILDRFDSIIFTAPVIIILNQFIPLVTLV